MLTILLAHGFADGAAEAKLGLTDGKAPLQELRPLDRRVYVLALEGKWYQPAQPGVNYYINFLFDNGRSYSHLVDDEAMFRKGEVRCIIQTYRLARNGVADGGHFSIVVSAGKPVTKDTAPEVMSNAIRLSWPMRDREITAFRPRTRYSEPEAVDAFPIPGEKSGEPPTRLDRPGTTPPPPTAEPPVPAKPEEAPPPSKSADKDAPAKAVDIPPPPKPRPTKGPSAKPGTTPKGPSTPGSGS
jgi:hypothetical protein